nr:MAG: structural protein [Totiviridae sp.]
MASASGGGGQPPDKLAAAFQCVGQPQDVGGYSNVFGDSDDEGDVASVVSWASEAARTGPQITTSDTTGLRCVCGCPKETRIRALYLRKATRPRPLQKWRVRFPWVAKIFSAVIQSSELDPRGYHEHFRAAWAFTIARAFERAEKSGIIFNGPEDPLFHYCLGTHIEYTPVAIPFPIPSDLSSCALEFYGHQRAMHHHLAPTGNVSSITANEAVAAHLCHLVKTFQPPRQADPPPDAKEEPLPVAEEEPHAADVPERVPSPPATPEPKKARPSRAPSVASSVGSNLSADAPVYVPKTPPPGYEADGDSLAGVKKKDDHPGLPVPEPGTSSAPQSVPAKEEVAGQPAEQAGGHPSVPAPVAEPKDQTWPVLEVSPTHEDIQKNVMVWVSNVEAPSTSEHRVTTGTQTPQKMEGKGQRLKPTYRRQVRRTRLFSASSSQSVPSAELTELPPRDPSPTYTDAFFDGGPTEEEGFRVVAGVPAEIKPDSVPCDHRLFHEAVRLKYFRNPERYCRHVRRALATVILRHPADWGVNSESCQVLGAFVEHGYLPTSLTSLEVKKLDRVDYEDPLPVRSLQDHYTIEVKNRFTPLFEEEVELIEAELADCDVLTAGVARTAQRQGKRPHPTAQSSSEQAQRRQKKDAQVRVTREQLQDVRKTKDQRKRDSQAALRRIAQRMSGVNVRDIDVAKTVIVRDSSPAVRKLLEEQHHWLRDPGQAMSRGKWCWAAACINNCVSPHVAVAGLFKSIRCLAELGRATGSSCWIRDLCADGDVEHNPGPAGVVNVPFVDTDLATGVMYMPWIQDSKGIPENTLSESVRYLNNVGGTPDAYADNVNSALVLDAQWYRAYQAPTTPIRVGTWSTTLYPTTLGDWTSPFAINMARALELDASKDHHVDSVPHTALPAQPVVEPPSPTYDPRSPGGPDVDAGQAEGGQPQQQPAQQPAAGVPAAPAAQPGPVAEPAPEPDPREQHVHPDQPDVLLTLLDEHGAVLKVTSSKGRGVAMPLSAPGVLPSLQAPAGYVMAISSVTAAGTCGSPRYAARLPITMVHEGENLPAVFINGVEVPYDEAAFLRELKSSTSPQMTTVTGARVYLIGEWYDVGGNGATGALPPRTWGPPKFAYAAKTGIQQGSVVLPTAKGTAEVEESKTKAIIVPRTEVTAIGIDKTTAERLSLTPTPSPTTCEANALKLGLMLDWAKYGEQDAPEMSVLTGQAQVHEPRVRISADTTITRLFNASGIPREDCGGLVVPCFPFHQRWRRGKLRFFTTAQLVPKGEPYIFIPSCFDGQPSFVEAAVFLLSFLPWPWGNMSLLMKTAIHDAPGLRDQIYGWYGTTTVVPGFLNLNVVLHQTNVGEYVTPRSADTEMGLTPRMGPTAVEFWPANATIPVNCKAGQQFYVASSAFAASWACGFDLRDLKAVVTKINVFGLFDVVDRWLLEGPTVNRCHAGLMAVAKAKLNAGTVPTREGQPRMKTIFDAVPLTRDDPVPLLYRCWAPAGNRLDHIGPKATWTDIKLAPEATIIMPDLHTLSMIYAGFWQFANVFPSPYLAVDYRLLSAVQFLTCERMFVAWHMWHGVMGLDTATIAQSARAAVPGRGETDYYDSLFGYGTEDVPPLGNLLRLGLEKVIGGKLLRSVDGVCILQRMFPPRRWQAQVYDLTDATPLTRVCPTPLTDIYVYRYVAEVPQAWMPFKVTCSNMGNKDTFGEEKLATGFPPANTAGTPYWTSTARLQDVDLADIVRVRDHSLWLNRLMHHYDAYELRDLREGHPVPNAPPVGYAPIALRRGDDDWAGPTMDLHVECAAYPFFATVWSSWMDRSTHRVLTLQCTLENANDWYALTAGEPGALSTGVQFQVVQQPTIPMPVKANMANAWITEMKRDSENAGGGAVKEDDTPPNSGGGSTDAL